MQNDFEEREELFEQYLNYDSLKAKYQSGQIKGLDKHERSLLEFCHGRDMRAYLQEKVGDEPIVLNPDGSVNWELTKFRPKQKETQETRDLMCEVPNNQPFQETYQQPQQYYQPPASQALFNPSVNEQKFYYLYDDDGNLIAAIPKK